MESYRNHTAFTLIELVVAVTILSVIMLSVFVIYTNLINVNRKLEQTRILQEQTRLITETIASDVRENGIDFLEPHANGTLVTKSGNRYALQQKAGDNIFGQCDPNNHAVACQLVSAVDMPVSSDSVDVRNLHFSITGTAGSESTNEDIEGKVQVVFDIGIAPKK